VNRLLLGINSSDRLLLGINIKTMITNSLRILGARANAECLEDRLGIMVGDGKAAFGRRRSADAANREAYEEYSRHYCSGDGDHAGGRSRAKAPLRLVQGSGVIGSPVAVQEEVLLSTFSCR